MTALDALLGDVGLHPDGPLGPTHDGVRLAVRDGAGRRWALTVVPAPDVERVRRRAGRLAGVRHPHLAETGPCIDLGDGSLAVLQGEVRGTDLATVRQARAAWSPGEVVTVVVPLAEALAALHDAGLAHGDVAPGNVMLRPDGRPVLVDLLCGDGPDEAGTPGLAAPERPAGATPAADVYALGRLGATLLAGPGGTGGPGLGPLLSVLATACTIDPARRPTARALASDVYAACPPTAVDVPDAAVLARLALRRLAAPDAPATIRRSAAGRRIAGGRDGDGDVGQGGTHRARHRARRRLAPRALGPLAGVAIVAAASAGVLLDRDAEASVGRPGPAPAAGLEELVLEQPVAAAVRLTRERVQALADADPAGLADLTVVGSPAWLADRAAAPRRAGWAPAGPVVLRIVSAAVLGSPGCAGLRVAGAPAWPGAVAPGARAPCTPTVRVAVESEAGVGGAVTPSAVVLVLRPTTSGWRVSAVEPYAP